jgi:hypothetical protein
MRTQNLAHPQAADCAADVAMPQPGALGIFSCQFGALSAIVHAGPSDLAYVSQWGPAQGTALQENRSRGCRASKSPFWHFAWLPSWLHAPRKKKSSTLTSRRSPSSRPTPANTSNPEGRAYRAAQARPALSIFAARQANFPSRSAYLFAYGRSFAYSAATRTVSNWRITCGPLPLSPCWLLPPSLLARSLLPSLKLRRCRLSRPKPANTNNQTGQAPYGSAPFGRLPVGMVASC